MSEATVQSASTLSDLFLRRVQATPDRVAYEFENGDHWDAVTYAEYGEFVRDAALGLLALGMPKGGRIAVWGDTMAEWSIVDLASMALGGCAAGIYQTCTPDQGAYIINDCNACVVVVDGPERLEKALSIRDETPGVSFYVTWGGGEAASEQVYSLEHVLTEGRAYGASHPGAYEEAVGEVGADTTATLVYTSGTTGPPKGAMLSHRNCLFCAEAVRARTGFGLGSSNVAFLPMSHVAEHVVSFYTRLYTGSKAYFMPDMTRFAEAARTKAPTTIMAVPRLYEKAYAAILEKKNSGSGLKAALFDWAVKQGDRVWQCGQAGKPLGVGLRICHAIADRLVLTKIRGAFGGNIKFLGSGAAPISTEIVTFFNAVGMTLIEAYGMTESSGISHINAIGKYRVGTVGTVIDGYECRIADDGEILVRGDGVFQGYLNKPEATAEAIDAEGWLHTGDIGKVDADGFLRITDRKKNIIVTAGGKNVAPANIELLVNREPLISQVLVVGDKRRYLSALITLSADELEKLRKTDGYSSLTLEELMRDDFVTGRVRDAVDSANATLARFEQIKRYKIIDREFSIEHGEVTPTMKLKRNVVEKAFESEIEALYD